MRFMVMMIPGAQKRMERGETPDPKLIEAMMTYNAELGKAGVLLALDGLHPTSKGARLAFKGGKATVKDGPFTEAREMIGGYWMWQVRSKEEAIEWAKRCPAEDGDTLELRQVFEMSDFGPEVEKQEAARVAQIGSSVEKNARR
ncbi:MAG TPA: YciI family protein [Gemmatimonadaceae bacterium]|jgi:hypothetical protein